MNNTIITYRYLNGSWHAYFAENASIWECGTTEAEAIGKLVKSFPDRFNTTIQRKEQQEPKVYPDLASAQAAMDRGETVRIEMEPFSIDPALVQLAIDLQHKERFEHWKAQQSKEQAQ